MRFPIILFFVCFVFLSAQTEKPDSSSEYSNYYLFNLLNEIDSNYYYSLLDSIKNGTSSDYFKLRLAFTKTGKYEPYGIEVKETYAKIEEAFEAGNFKKGLELAESVLSESFTEIKAQMYAGYACEQLNKEEKAKYHYDNYNNLLNSIYLSGDGKTPETAFIVFTTSEEYIFIYWVNLKFESQSLINKDGFAFDLMKCTDEKTGENFDLHFNITSAINHLQKSFDKL